MCKNTATVTQFSPRPEAVFDFMKVDGFSSFNFLEALLKYKQMFLIQWSIWFRPFDPTLVFSRYRRRSTPFIATFSHILA